MSEAPTHPKWSWGIGESSERYYDYWCYHNNNEYELHMYWDAGQGHSVEVIPIEGKEPNGDLIYGYEQDQDTFRNREQAFEYVEKLMDKYA